MKNPHVIKFLYEDGILLKNKKSWCGEIVYNHNWAFQDSNHAILAIETQTTTQPCEKCIIAIQNLLSSYLKDIENV